MYQDFKAIWTLSSKSLSIWQTPSDQILIIIIFSLWQTPSKIFLELEFWSLLRILYSIVPWSLHGHIIFCKLLSLLLTVKVTCSHMLGLCWIRKHTFFYANIYRNCATLEGMDMTIIDNSECKIHKHSVLHNTCWELVCSLHWQSPLILLQMYFYSSEFSQLFL